MPLRENPLRAYGAHKPPADKIGLGGCRPDAPRKGISSLCFRREGVRIPRRKKDEKMPAPGAARFLTGSGLF